MDVTVNAIGLVVADLAASTAFYERLGCRFEFSGPHHAEATLGGFRLMLDAEVFMREHGFLTGPAGARNTYALAAECASPELVDATYAGFQALGAGLTEPFDAPWGQRYATVHDPDGTRVDLYAPLPS